MAVLGFRKNGAGGGHRFPTHSAQNAEWMGHGVSAVDQPIHFGREPPERVGQPTMNRFVLYLPGIMAGAPGITRTSPGAFTSAPGALSFSLKVSTPGLPPKALLKRSSY